MRALVTIIRYNCFRSLTLFPLLPQAVTKPGSLSRNLTPWGQYDVIEQLIYKKVTCDTLAPNLMAPGGLVPHSLSTVWGNMNHITISLHVDTRK